MPSSTNNQEPLYTNTGDWYYNKVTDDANTTITFETYEYNDGYDDYPELKVTIGNDEPIETTIPEWTSENGMDNSALPIFIFKTNDGKYGIEGVVSGCGGMQDAEPEYVKRTGGMMYYRFIQGNTEPTLEYAFADEMSPSFSVTLSNGQVSYNNLTFPSINGKYELYLSGQTSGEYVLGKSISVIDSTEFYCCGWCGSTTIEIDEEIGDSTIVYGNVIGSICKGKISTILDPSNSSFYVILDSSISSTPTFTLDTQPTEDEKGTVINYIDVTSDGASIGAIWGFIVPKYIYEPVSIPVIPKTESIPMVGWSSVKKITLDNFDYKSGGFISPYKARAILTVNGINGLTGYVYTDNSGSTPIQKIKLYSGSSEVSGTITADIYLLLE